MESDKWFIKGTCALDTNKISRRIRHRLKQIQKNYYLRAVKQALGLFLVDRKAQCITGKQDLRNRKKQSVSNETGRKRWIVQLHNTNFKFYRLSYRDRYFPRDQKQSNKSRVLYNLNILIIILILNIQFIYIST